MSFATVISALQVQCNCWSLPVTDQLGRRCRNALSCLLLGGYDGSFQQAAGLVNDLAMSDTSSSADPRWKTLNQIPIAPRQPLTPVPHPAVSSLEASQTPAR